MSAPAHRQSADEAARSVIEATDGRIVLALPLGLGKANHFANALFDKAAADRSVELTIFTALTLEKPSWSSDMERRFVRPLVERLFPDYPGLRYAQALRRGELPPNIQVSEFFFLAGRWLSVDAAQQAYVSANYTHAGRYVMDRGINVIGQLVAERGEGDGARYSLSCNTDITLDILPALRARSQPFMLVGEVSDELPFMTGDAELPASAFHIIVDGPGRRDKLFVVPRAPVSDADHAIGIRAASLVKDGGTLQIGIGSLGDAFTAGLILRHREPKLFREALEKLGGPRGPETCAEPFERGVYGASEMFVDGFADLYREGILRRRAADGAILHGGFFVGSNDFYGFLRNLDEEECALFAMRGISFVNELYGDEDTKRRDRVHARFVNNAMMVTLLGATVSDALEDGRVVSGVGGQYNFVAQAFALEDARSIITLNASRMKNGRATSRLVWSYGHNTIPRHLRDVVVTEYGIADLRGHADRDCVEAMLAIADSRFQENLLKQARDAGKIESGYRIPPAAASNRPEHVAAALQPLKREGWCAPFPFGTDFTPEEQLLLPALDRLKQLSGSKWALARAALSTLGDGEADESERAALERMDLAQPGSIRERLYAKLLLNALRRTAARS